MTNFFCALIFILPSLSYAIENCYRPTYVTVDDGYSPTYKSIPAGSCHLLSGSSETSCEINAAKAGYSCYQLTEGGYIGASSGEFYSSKSCYGCVH